MDIRPGAVPLGGFDRATVLARVKAAAEAADARKREIRADAGKALASPRLSASETAKSQARQKVQQIRERLNILKKL